MYNAQSFTVGANSPSTSLGRSNSNGRQMLFSQGSTDFQKAQQMLQQLRKQELNNFDCKPSDCNTSGSGSMMASIGCCMPENFQSSTGLMRYHSAPGSFLATLAKNGNDVMPHVSGARLDNGLSQILSNDSALTTESNSGVMKHNDSSQSSNIQQEKHSKNQDDYSRMTVHNSSHLSRTTSNVAEENMSKNSQLATILENGIDVSRNSFCGSQMSMMCQAQGPRPGEQLVNGTYKCDPLLYNSLNSSDETPGSLTSSAAKNSLVRHSSSPAGALSQVTSNAPLMAESGYLERVMTSSNMGMAAPASGNSSCGNLVASNRLSHHMNFLRQSSSPAQLLNQLTMDMDIPEIVDKFSMNVDGSSAECLVRCSSDSPRLGNAGRSQGYIPSLSTGSWEDGTMLSGNYEGIQNSGRKRGRDIDEKMISGLHFPEKLKGEDGSHSVSALGNHHFGLFKSTSAEMAMEKLLEDSVPCRIRAKRGCATHPRSIAERVRRTRISDRMRKLQELVPNMDKQTNTADMLDEAVEYVKLLQKQVQELSEKQKKCDCASRKQHMLTKHGLVEEEGLQIEHIQ